MSLKLLRSCRSDERGIALVMALLMVLAVSILTSGLITVANSEALSSLNYTTMTQVRYGAESGIHPAANHLLDSKSYEPPSAVNAADPISAYDITKSPVTLVANGQPVILSSDPGVSNYKSSAAVTAFADASKGTLNVNNAPVTYRAQATLLSMKVLKDYSNQGVTLQTWEIIGSGRVSGAGAAMVEVSTVIERQAVPAFGYAAFATYDGCEALSFAGGATTKSYDSGAALSGGKPEVSNADGNVGTNGGLATNGNPTTINGTLSTPRTGVGKCTTGNVTAGTEEDLTHTQGRVALPQPVTFPPPEKIDPAPPPDKVDFKSGCGDILYCTKTGDVVTIAPPTPTSKVSMGNIDLNGGAELHLGPGIYEVNSIKLTGNAKIVVDADPANPKPVIFKVAGGHGVDTPIDLAGGGVSNPSFSPTLLQFIYGGDGDIKMTGGTDTAALVYAPNASASFSGGTDFYGSIITKYVTSTGGATIYYDRRLRSSAMVAGNPTMTTFSWRTF